MHIVSHQRSVLITGISSGIGNTVAVHLAQQGYTVSATVRKITTIVDRFYNR